MATWWSCDACGHIAPSTTILQHVCVGGRDARREDTRPLTEGEAFKVEEWRRATGRTPRFVE